jgi:uncharacterized protein YraI
MKRKFLVFIPIAIVLSVVFSFSIIISNAQTFGSNWTASYFNNTTFTAPPALTRIDAQINFNYGLNGPGAPVNLDNFSVIWTGAQSFTAGTYRFTAVADDGIRVTIDGTTIIDRLAPIGGTQTITADVIVTDGTKIIEVRFVENTGNAIVQFYWQLLSGAGGTPGGPTPTVGPTFTPTNTSLPAIAPGALRATVIRAGVLNVRDAPSLGGGRLGTILRGQTYAVVGRNANATWFLLQLSTRRAWAWGYYLFIDGNEFNAPVVSVLTEVGLPPGITDTGVLAVTQAGLRLRAEPNVSSAQIGRVTWGSFVPIVGRTAFGDWYQIVWKGTVGWVAAGFLEIRQGNLNNVPIR